MYLLQNYFDQMKGQTGQKSSNGTVLAKFFEPSPGITTPKVDVKATGDELGQAVIEVLKSWGEKHNLKFNFTRKVGKPT